MFQKAVELKGKRLRKTTKKERKVEFALSLGETREVDIADPIMAALLDELKSLREKIEDPAVSSRQKPIPTSSPFATKENSAFHKLREACEGKASAS